MHLLIGLLLSLLVSCKGQDGPKQLLAENNKRTAPADTGKPKINYRVNKQYDDKGNLVRYDSSYSYVYPGQGRYLNTDSLFNSFRLSFPEPKMFTDKDSSFFSDPFFHNRFPGQDFFQKQWEWQRMLFDRMNSPQLTPEQNPPKNKKQTASLHYEI
jgi:hypothetical protein